MSKWQDYESVWQNSEATGNDLLLLLAFGADTSIVNAAGETVFDLGLAELLGGS